MLYFPIGHILFYGQSVVDTYQKRVRIGPSRMGALFFYSSVPLVAQVGHRSIQG